MSAAVPISDLFQGLLPQDRPNGWLAMLRAYFDDSGTHDRSKVVLLAGVFGTEWELTSLQRLWQKHLDQPLCGSKPPLKRFHMSDCHDSRGEFEGWTRTETDYFCHQLQTAIIDSGVAAYGMACARKDWDDLVTGDMRAILGDPEGFCVRNCFVKTIEWAKANTFDPEMTFIFDDRPHRQRENKVVFDAFKRQTPYPHLVGIAFMTSHKIIPLQAADMIAWEMYQHANDILIEGLRAPRRKQMLQLGMQLGPGIRLVGQIALRERIGMILDFWKQRVGPEQLKAVADHFMTFDPDAISEEQSS